MKNLKFWVWALLLVGCASTQRDCASCSASSFGANWVVVQMATDGQPFRCWELQNVSIDNEGSSDGVYWQDPHGNLVHISGFYNRVQVNNGRWDEAFGSLGLTRETCRAVRDRQVQVPPAPPAAPSLGPLLP